MSIFKKTIDSVGTVINKAQVSTAAMNLEAQKKAKENTVMQEIQRLKTQREGVHGRIGQQCYDLYKSSEFSDHRFLEYLGILDRIASDISTQEAMLADVQKKFDEEIALLRGTTTSTTGACIKCGKPYRLGTDLFCSECGTDLRFSNSTCPNCGQGYNSEQSVFCKKCGVNLKAVNEQKNQNSDE